MPPNGRAYRTRLEVLRDILGVPGDEANKSRIIRLANLNPTAFDRYVRFCLETGLLELEDNRYRKTGVSVPAIQAINHVLAKAGELGTAIRDLGTTLGREGVDLDSQAPVVRFASAAAWGDLTRSGAPGNGSASYDAASPWVKRVALVNETAASGPRTGRKGPRAGPPPPPRARPTRAPGRRSPRRRGV